MKKLAMVVASLALVSLPTVGFAHHSPVAVYDMASRTKKTGVIKKINWVNPHIYVELEVMEKGKPVVWQLESMPPSFFQRAGVRKRDLDARVGQKATATIMTARNGAPLGFLRVLDYDDGTHLRILRDDEAPPAR